MDLPQAVAPLGGLVAAAAVFDGGRRWGRRRPAAPTPPPASAPAPAATPGDPLARMAPLDPAVDDVLSVLRSIAVVVDDSDRVVRASEIARRLGVVTGTDLGDSELKAVVRDVRRAGRVVERIVEVPRGPFGGAHLTMNVRAARLRSGHVLLLLEDRTQAERVEAIRRDFVANVSHELKTPVGGLALLAEAVGEAHDDPEAVAHFARRMRVEADRLARLVKEIVDLSRLQVSDALADPQEVVVEEVVADAVDRCRVVAEGRGIDIDVHTAPGVVVFGDRDLLTTAVRNLVDNAVAYSDDHSRVAVSTRAEGDAVAVAVADHGVGIPASEQERVFERFYRVDPARSRSTGGTGLGLSIVKHTAANHGGEVRLWSEEGQGSTFTLVLPHVPHDRDADTDAEHADSTPHPSAEEGRP